MIQLSAVCKSYPRDQDDSVQALRDISFQVTVSEFLAVRGPSGSGKSTLLNILGCLDVPSSGAYYLDGEDVSHCRDRELSRVRARKIGFIFQSFNLLLGTTALENVELPMVYGSGRVDRKKARSLLERVGLQDRAAHFGNELWGGQQQRVAIARALVNDPPLILADEPTGNLDTAASEEVINLLEELHREGRTIVLVTHDDTVASHAAREIVLRDGVISSDKRRQAPQEVAPDDFQIQNEKSLLEAQFASAGRLGSYFRWIGMSGLVVSGLGILEVCWIAVKGRTVEIGTRRALGACALDVFVQILLEAAIVCAAGCALGLAIGWQGTRVLAQRANLPFVFEASNAWLTIAVSVAMNFSFALLPATQASRVNPIRALKHE